MILLWHVVAAKLMLTYQMHSLSLCAKGRLWHSGEERQSRRPFSNLLELYQQNRELVNLYIRDHHSSIGPVSIDISARDDAKVF